MLSVFATNCVGVVLTTQALLPLLRAGAGKGKKTIVNLSSQLGSIEMCFGVQGRYGGVASYRMSRAANNMATRTFAGELKPEGFLCVALSPGWVQTDMGSSGARAPPLTIETSVTGMLDVVASLTVEDTGTFRQYDGATLPW
jgi:NAD(P)-dependent dehydrogenase (short-subunit alcohol dehydrogenase family)